MLGSVMHKNLALATATLALSAFGLASAFPPAENRKLKYFDPDDRRIHASVEAVVADGRLQLGVSALGATVEPLPGFRGRAGANLQTAFEIDQLIAGERLEIVTFDRDGHRMSSGEIRPGNRGRVPVRRLRDDGAGALFLDGGS